jgi:hypothetical protein
MSDGFPSRSCADAIFSHGEVDEDEDRSPPVRLVSCRGHRTGEVRTQLPQEPRALWTVMRVGRSMVVPGPDAGRPG